MAEERPAGRRRFSWAAQLPPTGAIVIAAPLRLVGGTGSPLRVLAIVEG